MNLKTLTVICLIIISTTNAYSAELLIKDKKSNAIKATYNVELATTTKQRATGLMHRKELKTNHGMLFTWELLGIRKMWMKNTYIPLDMLFIKDNTIIGLHKKAIPHDLTPVGIEQPINKVLELNYKEIQKHNITIGDKIELQL